MKNNTPTPSNQTASGAHLVVMGDSQSGKTSLQAALMCPSHVSFGLRATPQLRTENKESRAYLMEAYHAFANRGFPSASTEITEIAVRLFIPAHESLAEQEHVIRFTDMAGELHTTALDPENPLHARLIDAVLGARGLVYLFDLAAYCTLEPTEAARRLFTLRQNIDTFQQIAVERGMALIGGRLPIRVALTLTKAERYLSSAEDLQLQHRLVLSEGRAVKETTPGLPHAYKMECDEEGGDARDPAAVARMIASYRHGANLLTMLRSFFFEVSTHVASAVGMYRDGGVWVPNIVLEEVTSNGAAVLVERVRDPAELCPIGLFDPLVYLLRSGEVAPRATAPVRVAPVWSEAERAFMEDEAAAAVDSLDDIKPLHPETTAERRFKAASIALVAMLIAAFVGLLGAKLGGA